MQKKSAGIAFSIAIIIIVFSCASCKKSSNSTDTTCTLSASSLAGTWSYKNITYQKTPTSPVVNILGDPTQFAACQKDNTNTFSANGGWSYNDLGVICSPNASIIGTWTLSNNIIQLSALGFPWPVTSFDCQTMVVTINNYDTTGDQEIYTFQKD